MQVFARVYNTFPSLLYVETPALPRFASRSVTMRGGLLRVLDEHYTRTSIITFMGGASPPWSGVRGDRRYFESAPFWRGLGPRWALFSLFFALGHVSDASWAPLGQFYVIFNDFLRFGTNFG